MDLRSLGSRVAVVGVLALLVAGCGGGGGQAAPVCGDGRVGLGEACDGSDLAGQTCAGLGLGFTGGTLACDASCALVTTGCTSPAVCGNGLAQAGEACDGNDLQGMTCSGLGFADGTLGCTAACTFETAACVPLSVCGDGVKALDEACDDGNQLPGDGCDPSCGVEQGWSCSGTTSTCIRDRDGDGVTDAADNCPDADNPIQEDMDADGIGDACDACPAIANPGGGACPVTIYDLKGGALPVGTAVSLRGALVTARSFGGYFLQVKAGDPGYLGPDFSGVWVAQAGSAVAPGDRVDVTSARLDNFFGQWQLVDATAVQVGAAEAPPAPVVALPSELVFGGSRAAALEGVLVQVQGVTVTDVNPLPGPGDAAPTGEFAVEAGLRVDDLFHAATPFPALGAAYASITGVLGLRNGDSKLAPRGAADLVPAAPALAAFGPAGFVRVGQAGAPTIPQPLTVALAHPMGTDTFVAVTSSEPASLQAAGGGVTVPAGQTTAVVALDGLAAAASVTLTATLGAGSLTAAVQVLDGTEAPALTMTPAEARVPPGLQRDFTVHLSLPAPPGGLTVALSVVPADAASVPASVTVPADQVSASFSLLKASAALATVTATAGASSASAIARSDPTTGLLINEVDYDNLGQDGAEFVEVLNAGATPVLLDGVALYLVNGLTGATYLTIDLSPAGTLAPGQYLVVAAPAVASAAGALVVPFPGTYPTGGILQNGAPDGIALVDTVAGVLLDALDYEEPGTPTLLAAVTMLTPTQELGPVSLVSGEPTPAADSNFAQGSLARLPDGSKTGDDRTDWKFSPTPTPGAANLP